MEDFTNKYFFNLKDDNSNNKINYEYYYIIKDNYVYKIIIEKTINYIKFKYKNYIFILDKNNINILNVLNLNSIDEAYNYITNSFDENNVNIKNFIANKELILLFKEDKNNKNDIEINLLYNNLQSNGILQDLINKNNELEKKIITLKEEINILKEEILKIKEINSNPNSIKLISELTEDSYSNVTSDNSFTVFKSINDILCLIYSNKNKSIICHDLVRKKKICEIKSHHKENINNFRHYLDEKNKRDLIISLSNKDNNLKIWNINNWECLLNLSEVYNVGYLFSACLLKEGENFYIVTSNCNLLGDSESIHIYDFNGNKIIDLEDSNELTYFIDIYYDKNMSKIYILTGNKDYVKSYDYNNKKLYHKYYDGNKEGHQSIVINDYSKKVKLIESSFGIVRIWNFHLGYLISKIKITYDDDLRGLCLWNNDYLFVGCYDNTIKLVNLKNGMVVKNLFGHNNYVITIKKIMHPQYGECLISQGWKYDQIKIWSYNN